MTGDFNCKRRVKDRLWYGSYGRRRGVCKVFVRRNGLIFCWRGKRWTTAKGDLGGCPVDQTFCWASGISNISSLKVKLKPIFGDRFKCKTKDPSKLLWESWLNRWLRNGLGRQLQKWHQKEQWSTHLVKLILAQASGVH